MSHTRDDKVRTAVVIVHGMGEQLPLDTLQRFLDTALPKVRGRRVYYSRPERVTTSFEARRMLAPPIRSETGEGYGQTEFFEYHWSYLMKENRLDDLFPVVRRMLLNSPHRVPSGLRVAWVLAWLLVIGFLVTAWLVVRNTPPEDRTVKAIVVSGVGVVGFAIIRWVLNKIGALVTRSFVDVVRYLDRSPRSYEVRRNIRAGMVDLLQRLHDDRRYSRIVVVAHSLGAYIAYDGITYLWPQMCNLHGGPVEDDPVKDDGAALPLTGLKELEAAANAVREAAVPTDAQLTELSGRQFELWRQVRLQGNPWLITDFISLGTPMYFADQLFAKDRKGFDRLVSRAELPVCPPVSATKTVEDPEPKKAKYGHPNLGRTVLGHATPFAVVRWTNLWFPARLWFFGDWFGGPLQPLFGKGVLDIPIQGNKNGRFAPAIAHGKYLSWPDRLGPDDVATLVRHYLDLDIDDQLEPLLRAPEPLPETD